MWNLETDVLSVKQWDYWKQFNIIKKTSESHNWRLRREGATENSYIAHCTQTAGSVFCEIARCLEWQTPLHVSLTRIVNTK